MWSLHPYLCWNTIPMYLRIVYWWQLHPPFFLQRNRTCDFDFHWNILMGLLNVNQQYNKTLPVLVIVIRWLFLISDFFVNLKIDGVAKNPWHFDVPHLQIIFSSEFDACQPYFIVISSPFLISFVVISAMANSFLFLRTHISNAALGSQLLLANLAIDPYFLPSMKKLSFKFTT